MQKKQYYIGLDPGTASIGFAVTDTNYNLIKKGKKNLWGTRLFNSGETAELRRTNRASRNSLMRKKERINLLQEIFEKEVLSIDSGFFIRIKDSMYHSEDKTVVQFNSLFNDKTFKDKDYFKKYKTIYHLKYDLIKGNVYDPRLLYLAISHTLKHRGHFLFDGQSLNNNNNLEQLMVSINEYLEEQNLSDGIYIDNNKLASILKNQKFNLSLKEKGIKELFDNKPNDIQLSIIKLMIGSKISLAKIFNDITKEDDIKFSLKENFDDNLLKLEKVLDDRVILIEHIKAIYDWIILADILKDKKYLCEAKVASYEQHKSDIKLLKQFIKTYLPEKYKYVFSLNKDKLCNYVSYVYLNKVNKKKQVINKKCTQEEFCKFLRDLISNVTDYDKKYDDIINSINLNTFAPKQLTNNNCVIPYQVNLTELEAMLDGCKNNIPFLNNKEGNLSNIEKIKSLLTFKIPYYVGHLNNTHSNSWIIKRNNNKITPWNFEEVVDTEKSAETFIRRMTNKCTYLTNYDVIPKDSLLYSRFVTLNEINNIKINGTALTIELKKQIYNELFEKLQKVTFANIKNFIKKKLSITEEIIITGVDTDIKSSLKSQIILNQILPNTSDDTKEEIIKQIVLFSGDKKILKSSLAKLSNFSKEEMKKLLSLNFSGWSRLSKEFLTTIKDFNHDTGEELNIINMMYETNNNLMQLLSRNYSFLEQVKNSNNISSKITLETIQDLYCSPAVKKTIWQSYKIIEDIVQYMGCKPTKIFVETTREEGIKERTKSRKKALLELYSSIKKTEPLLYDRLDKCEEKNLRSKKLYLYYTQLGRCAYTNKIIDIEKLFDNNIYDVEHIYPRSKSMDDSVINNLVLVCKVANQKKSDDLNIPDEYKQNELWNKLHKLKLISDEKYKRLIRNDEFTKEELEGFINRQLVETSQSSKAIIEILTNYLSDTKGKVIYTKAKNVSLFRQHFEITKNRELNDLHHAHDAYLNIVVGNVYDTKFTIEFFKNISSAKYSLKPEVLFTTKFINNDSWNDNTITIIKDSIYSKDVLFTRHSYTGCGQLFNLNPVKKNTGKNIGTPLKQNDKLADVTKYGSYTGTNPSYYVLIEIIKGDKKERRLVCIPVHISALSSQKSAIKDYISNEISTTDYKIILDKIKIDSLVKADGMMVHLSGGKDVKNAIQLKLPEDHSLYLKYILKVISNDNLNENDKIITNIKNKELFDFLIEKLNTPIYSKLSTLNTVYNSAKENSEVFINLSIKDQLTVIKELMKLFSCSAARANLKLINGSSEAGRQSINLNISKSYNKFILINQSITGIYENEIDLLTVTSNNEL